MSDEVSTAPAPATDVATIPPAPAVLDGEGNLSDAWTKSWTDQHAESRTSEHPGYSYDPATMDLVEKPSSPTLTLDKLGSSADRPAPLDSSGNISSELVESIAEKMRAGRPASDKAEAAKAPPGLEKYGDLDWITEKLELLENVTEPSGSGIVAVLQWLKAHFPEARERLRNLDVADNPPLSYAQSKLLLFGPEPESEPVERPYLSLDLASAIPPSLHPVARTVPEVVLREWAEAGFDGLTFQLQQYGEIQRQWREMNERANAELGRSFAQAHADGLAQLKARNERDIKAHGAVLEKWQPGGTDEELNSLVRNMVFACALNELLSDPQWSAVSEHVMFYLTTGPTYRVCGAFMKADENERTAREYSARFNSKLGQVMKATIGKLDPVFKAARSVESMAKRLAELEHEDEVGPEKFDEMGRLTDEWVQWVGRKHGVDRTPKAARSKGVEKFDDRGNLSPEWQAELKATHREQTRGVGKFEGA